MKRAQGLFYWFQFPHPAVHCKYSERKHQDFSQHVRHHEKPVSCIVPGKVQIPVELHIRLLLLRYQKYRFGIKLTQN